MLLKSSKKRFFSYECWCGFFMYAYGGQCYKKLVHSFSRGPSWCYGALEEGWRAFKKLEVAVFSAAFTLLSRHLNFRSAP